MAGPTQGHGIQHVHLSNHAPSKRLVSTLTTRTRRRKLYSTTLETPNAGSHYLKVLPPPRRWSSKRCLGIVETDRERSPRLIVLPVR